jgi:hypothetical protein
MCLRSFIEATRHQIHHVNDRYDCTYHSKSLYIIVKNTWRKRLTAFINTAKRYNHASPVIVEASRAPENISFVYLGFETDGVYLFQRSARVVCAVGTRMRSCVRKLLG